ncbi:MAG: tetratricopeptide repeat protein [Candidatus Marinimicrobia bacterium]|nr:tetratricopeptide repeat protein [Candidatus Neomarinimicrobiota bacterium]
MKISKIFIFCCFLSFCLSQDKGLEFYQNQEYDEAKGYYEKILLERGDNAQAHFGLGASSYQQGDIEVAKEGFQESLKTSDNNLRSKAFYNLGNTFYKNNKTNEALSFYRKALELNPNDKDALFNYEYLKYQKKPPEKDKENQEQKDQEQKDQEQKEEEQKEEEQKEEEQKEEEQQEEEQQEEEQQEEQQGQEKQQDKMDSSNEEKDQDLTQAESILDALKQDEKIMQKKQISRAKSRKLAKDW